MSDFVIPPTAIPSLPVAGDSRRFPVRRIYCVGRNYADHAMGDAFQAGLAQLPADSR